MVIPPEVLTHITEPMAQLYRIIPLKFEGATGGGGTLTVAMCDPQKLSIIDELRSFLGFDIKAMVWTKRRCRRRCSATMPRAGKAWRRSSRTWRPTPTWPRPPGDGEERLGRFDQCRARANTTPVRELLNMVLLLAIKEHASDLHFDKFLV